MNRYVPFLTDSPTPPLGSDEALLFLARSPSPVFGIEWNSLDLLNDTPVVLVAALRYLYDTEGNSPR